MSEITSSTYNHLVLDPRTNKMPNPKTGSPLTWRNSKYMSKRMADTGHRGDCNGWGIMQLTEPEHHGFKRL